MIDQTLGIEAILRAKGHADSVRAVLANFDTEAKVEVGEFAVYAPGLRTGEAPDILIVDISLDNDHELELLSQVIGARGGKTAVIATAANADLAGIRSLMRLGVADFLPQPFTKSDLLGAIESATAVLSRSKRSGGNQGHVISFVGSCGGAGTTTLAVQTAMELLGKSKNPNRVAVIDFDLQFGNVGLSLDIADKGGLPLIMEAPSRLDRALLQASMTEHDSGLKVLTAPSNIIPLTALSQDSVNRILTLARSEFDYVICDLPHAWTNWTASALRAADRILLTTQLTVSSLQRTKRILEIIVDQNLAEIPLRIMANRVDTGWGMGKRQRQAEEALGRGFDFIVRNDPKTAIEAGDQGIPLRQVKSGSVIVKDIRSMVETLKKELTETAGAEVEKTA